MTPEPRPVRGAFSVVIRLDGYYRLPCPDTYPGGADRYLGDIASYAADLFRSHVLYGAVEQCRIRVTQEIDHEPVPGAIA